MIAEIEAGDCWEVVGEYGEEHEGEGEEEGGSVEVGYAVEPAAAEEEHVRDHRQRHDAHGDEYLVLVLGLVEDHQVDHEAGSS